MMPASSCGPFALGAGVEEIDAAEHNQRERAGHGQIPKAAMQPALVAVAHALERAVDEIGQLLLPAPPVGVVRLRIREHIIGDKVSAMIADTVTVPTSVNANSVNSAPVRPP